jgi:hypothetical protein
MTLTLLGEHARIEIQCSTQYKDTPTIAVFYPNIGDILTVDSY